MFIFDIAKLVPDTLCSHMRHSLTQSKGIQSQMRFSAHEKWRKIGQLSHSAKKCNENNLNYKIAMFNLSRIGSGRRAALSSCRRVCASSRVQINFFLVCSDTRRRYQQSCGASNVHIIRIVRLSQPLHWFSWSYSKSGTRANSNYAATFDSERRDTIVERLVDG